MISLSAQADQAAKKTIEQMTASGDELMAIDGFEGMFVSVKKDQPQGTAILKQSNVGERTYYVCHKIL